MYTTSSIQFQNKQKKTLSILLIVLAILFVGCDNSVESDSTEKEEVTITFVSNGGSTVKPQSVTVNTHVIKPEAPVKESFIFAGWYSDYILQTKWEFTTTFATSDLVLYAKWDTEKIGTVTFNSNGGTVVPSQTVPIGTTLIEPKDPTIDGLEFAGWFRDMTLKSLWDFSADSVSRDITLYAKWIPEGTGFEVFFNSNGGTDVQKQMVEEGKYLIEPKVPSKEGLVFGGWYSDVTLKTLWDFRVDKVTKSIMLYAKWEAGQKKVVLSFNSNGGSAVQSQTLSVGGAPIEPKNPTKSGAIFVGWFKESSFTTLWDFSIDRVNDTMTLYAKWANAKEPMELVYYVNEKEVGSTIYLPFGDADDSVDLYIEWGDGKSEVCKESGWFQHTYEKNGVYTVKLFGTLQHFGCSTDTNMEEYTLLQVRSFGGLGLTNLAYAFKGADKLAQVPALLPSGVTNLKSCFEDARQFNGDISQWNTDSVTDMSSMFADTYFRQDISQWNTENVTDMRNMFNDASFDGDISQWNTESVTRMDSMFYASSFDGDISQWNTENVTDMSYMFYNTYSFNGDISQWNTENVTTMTYMFCKTSSFNQDISPWNTGSVTDMSFMFHDADSFNQDISPWNTENVTDMGYMFSRTSSFNQDLGQWNTGSVTDMSYMFSKASSFNGDISPWNTESVTDMSSMFSEATSFNGDLNPWNTENVTDMGSMFDSATSFNGDISQWNTINVTNMRAMFYDAISFNQDISKWNIVNVTRLDYMFNGASSFNKDISQWNMENITSLQSMFAGASSFNQDLDQWNTENVKNMSYMFDSATSFNGDISQWNTGNVTAMSNMFYGASDFNRDIRQWNTENVTGMSHMFENAIAFNQDLSQWDVSSVYYMNDFDLGADAWEDQYKPKFGD